MTPLGDPPPDAEEELGVRLAELVRLGLTSKELALRLAAGRVRDLLNELVLRDN